MDERTTNPYEELPPAYISEPHMLNIIIGDRSGSFAVDNCRPIHSLNSCINRYPGDICKDAVAAKRVELAVIAFNDKPEVVQNWRPIGESLPVELTPSGGTDIAAAVNLALDMVQERGDLIESLGGEMKIPQVILVTDGYGGDVTEVAERIRRRTEEHKLMFWVLAVKGYDKETVARLTGGQRVIELVDEDGYDFSEFFDFMAVSTKTASTSSDRVVVRHKLGHPEEGSNCRVPDLDAWLNP